MLPAQQRLVADMDEFERQAGSQDGFLISNSFVDRTSARVSSASFAMLKHIPVAALQLGERHGGSRVEGVVCCKATRQVAVQVLLEDALNSSRAVKVSMYNLMPTSTKMTDVRRRLPEGTKLAIRDPYYKVFMDGSSGIRVDNPADVIFLTKVIQSDPSTTIEDGNFDQMKAKGNQAFR